MKALLYKEFRLAMHPICYIFILAFPFMLFIPSYPLAIGFIYVVAMYPILFLGANKGQQSNDLLYSTLLPVRKKDIVKARIFTLIICQFVFMAIMCILKPFAEHNSNVLALEAAANGQQFEVPGIGFDGFVAVLGIGIIGFSIADLIYLSIYYKNGKSIVASSLIAIVVFIVFILGASILLPYAEPAKPLFDWIMGNQYIFLTISIVLYAGAHYASYKIGSNELEQVDF